MFSLGMLVHGSSSQTGQSVGMACLCVCYDDLGSIARFSFQLRHFLASVHGLFQGIQRNYRSVAERLPYCLFKF